jgi:hypothetical protein
MTGRNRKVRKGQESGATARQSLIIACMQMKEGGIKAKLYKQAEAAQQPYPA